MTLSVGRQSLDLHYFGPNHSDCLSIMVAKPANMAFIVDLANPPTGWHLEWNPTIPDTYIWNLVPTLTAIEELAERGKHYDFRRWSYRVCAGSRCIGHSAGGGFDQRGQ